MVIAKLDAIFARHGIPVVIRSDNGSPFQSDDFARYCKALGIKHVPVIPVWPQANGEVVKFNQPLEKCTKTSVLEGKVWRQEINRFLLQYRMTPHCKTKEAPCELLLNRQNVNYPRSKEKR